MKELSIEEKAKRYDEALKAAIVASKDEDRHLKATLERIFSELKEGRDERIKNIIKKSLRAYFEGNLGIGTNDTDYAECFSWLEKNGEQKPNTDFSDLRTWKYIVDSVLTEKEGIGQYLDSPFTEEVAKKLQKRFGNIEQKLAKWSEEDESNLQGIIDELKANKNHAPAYDLATYNRFLSWLKHLKDRYAWKPSDEQIKVCKEVYADILSAKGFDLGTVNSELNRLEEELKKLKG